MTKINRTKVDEEVPFLEIVAQVDQLHQLNPNTVYDCVLIEGT